MHIFRNDTHLLHTPVHEFYDGALIPPFESAERARIIDRALNATGYPIHEAISAVPESLLARIHTRDYLHYLQHIYARWCAAGGAPEAVLPSTLAVRWMHRHSPHPLAEPGYYAFDLSAPIVAGTWHAALDAASMAYSASLAVVNGATYTYARCRPPGHHAGSDMCGGYCYMNNAAIAAETALARGRVAILDIDIHHGNGTQQIFYAREDVTFVSIHGEPEECYPYFLGFADEHGIDAGYGHNRNIPLALGCDDATFLQAIDDACAFISTQHVHTLVISAGFDTYAGDPLGGFALTRDCYTHVGRRCAALGMPIVVVQEGGYAIDALGDNLVALLHGISGV